MCFASPQYRFGFSANLIFAIQGPDPEPQWSIEARVSAIQPRLLEASSFLVYSVVLRRLYRIRISLVPCPLAGATKLVRHFNSIVRVSRFRSLSLRTCRQKENLVLIEPPMAFGINRSTTNRPPEPSSRAVQGFAVRSSSRFCTRNCVSQRLRLCSR